MKPSIGKVVHYVANGTAGEESPSGVCRAALVTETGPIGTGLCVLNPTWPQFARGIREDEGKGPNTWHWPEAV